MKDLYDLIYIILLCIILGISFYMCSDSGYKNDLNKYKSTVNKSVIINKDTLKVIDYNIWENELILSNGNIISYEYFELNNIK